MTAIILHYGLFCIAYTFYVKFSYNLQNCFFITRARENQQESGEGGRRERRPESRTGGNKRYRGRVETV